MRIIEGFEQANVALSRQAMAGFYQSDLEPAVRQIINEVRSKGDAALRKYTLKFDGVKLTSLEVTKRQIASAYRKVDEELLSSLKFAAERIRSFHNTQKDNIWSEFTKMGLSQLVRPLERIGVYAPGGTASYPSTVLMTAIPARVAGVREVILVTPPREGGAISAATLVAADILYRFNIPIIGITDGDLDKVVEKGLKADGSLIVELERGCDDLIGEKIFLELFNGRETIEIENLENFKNKLLQIIHPYKHALL